MVNNNETTWSVFRDKAHLVFVRDGVEVYEPAIPAQADVAWFFRHMGGKTWFTPELKAETMRLVREYYGGEE